MLATCGSSECVILITHQHVQNRKGENEMNIKEFEFMCPNKIIFTHHLADSLRSAKAYLKVSKAFVVTDPGLAVVDK